MEYVKLICMSVVISLCVWWVNQMTYNVPYHYLIIIIVVLCIVSNMCMNMMNDKCNESSENLILGNRPIVSQHEEAVANRDILSDRPKNDIKA